MSFYKWNVRPWEMFDVLLISEKGMLSNILTQASYPSVKFQTKKPPTTNIKGYTKAHQKYWSPKQSEE